MGYYTYFTNHDTKLDRSLTEDETSEFNDLVQDFDAWWEIKIEEISSIKESFLCIYDEDSMKAYDWRDELKHILNLFTSFWVMANWSISWDWEESGDIWICSIKDNEAFLSNFANILDVISHLRDAWFDEAAKSIEYHYCEKL